MPEPENPEKTVIKGEIKNDPPPPDSYPPEDDDDYFDDNYWERDPGDKYFDDDDEPSSTPAPPEPTPGEQVAQVLQTAIEVATPLIESYMNVKNRTYQPPVMIEDPGMSDQSFDSVQPIGQPLQLDNGPFLYEKVPQRYQSKRYFNMPSESVLEKSRQAARKAPRVSQHPDMQAIRAQAKSAAKEIVAQSNIRHLRRELEPAIEKATEFVTTEAEPVNLNTILNPTQQVRPQFIQEDPTFIAQHLAAGATPITVQQQYQMVQAQQAQRKQQELLDAQIAAFKAQERLARQQLQASQAAAAGNLFTPMPNSVESKNNNSIFEKSLKGSALTQQKRELVHYFMRHYGGNKFTTFSVDKAIDILRSAAGKSGQLEDGIKYFDNSNNRPFGSKSFSPPIKINEVKFEKYFQHTLSGEGQDFVIDISNIPIDGNNIDLAQKFFREPSVSTAVSELLRTDKPQWIKVSLELPTSGDDSALVLGKLRLDASGTVHFKNGRVIFDGFIEQGNNGEAFVFPAGNRGMFAETINTAGRHLFLISFRTLIRGKKRIYMISPFLISR